MNEHDTTEQAYKSPIEILKETIIKETDDNIYKAVLDVGIKVDKEELIRALEYDRQQYESGYEAGYKAAKDEIVRCKDCKHYKLGKHFEDIRFCYRLPYYAEKGGLNVSGYDFCSYGKRKED